MEINEKNVRWTNLKCEECNGWILHDLTYDDYFCEKCGLILWSPYMEYEKEE